MTDLRERRAKIAKCPHGKVYAAHTYVVGDPISEGEALLWVGDGAPPWAVFDDVPTASINFSDCKESHD